MEGHLKGPPNICGVTDISYFPQLLGMGSVMASEKRPPFSRIGWWTERRPSMEDLDVLGPSRSGQQHTEYTWIRLVQPPNFLRGWFSRWLVQPANFFRG